MLARFHALGQTKLIYTSIVWLVILGGVFIRIAHYPNIPPGFNQDEASSAYEAYSLLRTGADRWGNPYPSYFPSWGPGQNVLLSYLSIPFIAVLGLNVFSARLVALILGILALPLFFSTLRPMGRFAAVFGTAVLAFVPWHFMLSRWALESNLLPFFMLLGCFCLSRALILGQRRWILCCLLPFALALYAYGTTAIVLPLLFLLVLLFFFGHIRKNPGAWLLSLLFFSIVSFPFGVAFFKNFVVGHDIGWTNHLFFSTPLHPTNRLTQVAKLPMPEIRSLNLDFIVRGCDDKTNMSLMPHYHLLYFQAIALAIAGFLFIVVQLIRGRMKRSSPANVVVLIFFCWFIASGVLVYSFELNVNRFNHFYIPCVVLGIWLISYVIRLVVKPNWLLPMQAFILFVFITSKIPAIVHYFTDYAEGDIKPSFNAGLEEAMRNADRLPVSQLFIANQWSLPYVYTIFFVRFPPERFQREAEYEISTGYYDVKRVGKYIFADDHINRSKPYGYLARKGWFGVEGKKVIFENEMWEVGIVE